MVLLDILLLIGGASLLVTAFFAWKKWIAPWHGQWQAELHTNRVKSNIAALTKASELLKTLTEELAKLKSVDTHHAQSSLTEAGTHLSNGRSALLSGNLDNAESQLSSCNWYLTAAKTRVDILKLLEQAAPLPKAPEPVSTLPLPPTTPAGGDIGLRA